MRDERIRMRHDSILPMSHEIFVSCIDRRQCVGNATRITMRFLSNHAGFHGHRRIGNPEQSTRTRVIEVVACVPFPWSYQDHGFEAAAGAREPGRACALSKSVSPSSLAVSCAARATFPRNTGIRRRARLLDRAVHDLGPVCHGFPACDRQNPIPGTSGPGAGPLPHGALISFKRASLARRNMFFRAVPKARERRAPRHAAGAGGLRRFCIDRTTAPETDPVMSGSLPDLRKRPHGNRSCL